MKTVGKAFAAGFGLVVGVMAGVLTVGAGVAAAHDAIEFYLSRKAAKGFGDYVEESLRDSS